MKDKLVPVVVALLLLAGLIYYLQTRPSTEIEDTSNIFVGNKASSTSATSTGDASKDLSFGGSSTKVSIPKTSVPPAPTYPQYRRTFTYPSYFTSEAQSLSTDKFNDLYARLDKNKSDIISWIELGNMYNLVRDYKGAEIAWLYATKLNPDHFIAYVNLGTLYMSDLRDFGLAEKNLLAARAADPSQIVIYRSLYELYRYGYQDDTKAKEILRQGIAVNPNGSSDLEYLLDHYEEV